MFSRTEISIYLVPFILSRSYIYLAKESNTRTLEELDLKS